MGDEPVRTFKKLIEVALPLEAINDESARDKFIRQGHPSTLHPWWSRKPLAASRAVLFASLIDDPDQPGVPPLLLELVDRLPAPEYYGPGWVDLSLAEQRRQRLFAFLMRIIRWDASTDQDALQIAQSLIRAATAENPPSLLDPFCGGGSIPLEAQRLGLTSFASDLNPVAVLISRAQIQIPASFAFRPPINLANRERGIGTPWRGATGLASDVRHYGRWMQEESRRRLDSLYPRAQVSEEGRLVEAPVLAWLHCRAVRCPNPACGALMPLASTWWLFSRAGKRAWVEPVVDHRDRTVRYTVRTGEPDVRQVDAITAGSVFTNEEGKKVKATFRCVACRESVVRGAYIDAEAEAGRMTTVPLAMVAEIGRRRVYLPSDEIQLAALARAEQRRAEPEIASLVPDEPARGTFASNAHGRVYGFKTFSDYFTARQLVILATFTMLVGEAGEQAHRDALDAGLEEGLPLHQGGSGALAYAQAVATYLGLAVSRSLLFHSSLARWRPGEGKSAQSFGMQGVAIAWNFAEVNPFAGAGGDFDGIVEGVAQVLERLPAIPIGYAKQEDARTAANAAGQPLICTDPPYYNNVSYADLADFFYVWLRRSLGDVFPDLFRTVLTPKTDELVVVPHRHNGDESVARDRFEEGLGETFAKFREVQHPNYPLIVFYAFKQAESDEQDGEIEDQTPAIASTGWETMLEGLLRAQFTITGTWPIRTENKTRRVAMGSNALASSIILVCRPRPADAPVATRRDFLAALKLELPDALRNLQQGNIAPVDLAQAAIGPGMAVYSRYARVLGAAGEPLSVRHALSLINQTLDEVLAEQEGDLDADTRWALAWFDQFGFAEGEYGVAETLSKAKNTSVAGMFTAGIVASRGGKVRLLRPAELSLDWDPTTDSRLTVWEMVHHLIRRLEAGGESAAAELMAKLGSRADVARELPYRLYVICERKKRAAEALSYNGLVQSWPEISRLAGERGEGRAEQMAFA